MCGQGLWQWRWRLQPKEAPMLASSHARPYSEHYCFRNFTLQKASAHIIPCTPHGELHIPLNQEYISWHQGSAGSHAPKFLPPDHSGNSSGAKARNNTSSHHGGASITRCNLCENWSLHTLTIATLKNNRVKFIVGTVSDLHKWRHRTLVIAL